jgi:bifunctional non-homologous end joining protein LigD
MTDRYQPMLATPWEQPFSDPGWWFEVKWDGYRAIAYGSPEGTELRSRRGVDLSPRYPEVAALRWERPVVVDGELVGFDRAGRPSFFALGSGNAIFVAFDLLFLEVDRCQRSFEERREMLLAMDRPASIALNDPVRGEGESLFEAVVEAGLEGIVAKRSGSLYHPGRRSTDWRKIPHRRRGRAVVGGYLAGEGNRRSTFGSLLLGLRRGDELHYVGSVGSGFDEATLRRVKAQLSTIEKVESPFANQVDVPGQKVYVEPQLVVEIEYREWTPYDRLRAPVFKGLSPDPPEAVTWEEERPSDSGL